MSVKYRHLSLSVLSDYRMTAPDMTDKENFKEVRSRRLSENVLFPKLFVMPEKIILGISTICLW